MFRFLCLNKHLNTLCWFVGIDEDDQNGTFLYSRESLDEGDLDDDIIADEQDPFLGTDIFLNCINMDNGRRSKACCILITKI